MDSIGVGDWVSITNGCHPGEVVRVSGVPNEASPHFRLVGVKGYGDHKYTAEGAFLQLVRKAGVFKVGDLVQCTSDLYRAISCGEDTRILGIEGNRANIEASESRSYAYNLRHFELVTPVEAIPEEPVQVAGDYEPPDVEEPTFDLVGGAVIRAARASASVIPQDDAERKGAPMYRGLLGYFAGALFLVAQHSMRSDRKHNPETPADQAPHWTMDRSTDHLDCIVRHMAELHADPDVVSSEQQAHELYHRTAIAWRGLAQLQEYAQRVLGWRRSAHARLSAEVEG